MSNRQTSPETDSPRRLRLRQRATGGVIASYIHGLSERHNGGGSREGQRGKLIKASQGG